MTVNRFIVQFDSKFASHGRGIVLKQTRQNEANAIRFEKHMNMKKTAPV